MNNLDVKVNEFVETRLNEETKLTVDYARALLTLEVQIKEIKDDIKEIKKDAKANGVAIGKVSKVIANMKKAMKDKAIDIQEMNMVEQMISDDVDIKTLLHTLAKKND